MARFVDGNAVLRVRSEFKSVVARVVVVTALASRLGLVDTGPSATELVGWVFVLTAPVLTGLIIARGGSNQSIAHVLYDVEHPGEPGQGSSR